MSINQALPPPAGSSPAPRTDRRAYDSCPLCPVAMFIFQPAHIHILPIAVSRLLCRTIALSEYANG